MKIITVVGARPNFMKVAPILAAFRRHNEGGNTVVAPGRGSAPVIDHILVHTGQHYDLQMSDSFFLDLQLPAPDIHLGIKPASASAQTAQILDRFSEVLLRERPDVVIVVGDVNSTVACALATAKVSFDSAGTRPLLAHVEAGLRSFDRSMPEEINRIVTDHVADLLFVTEESGLHNLKNEGVPVSRTHFVGNTMIDTLLSCRSKAEESTVLQRLGLRPEVASAEPPSRYALLTLHRPSNVDNHDTFREILLGLKKLAEGVPIIFPVHPRTQRRIGQFGLDLDMAMNVHDSTVGRRGLRLTDPLGYLDFLCLMTHAAIVVTDSGGIQEETTCLGVPCVTVRENTERPVTVTKGTNVIAGITRETITEVIQSQMNRSVSGQIPEKWDGHAASRIVDVLIGLSPANTSHDGQFHTVDA